METKRLTPQVLFDLGLLHDCKIIGLNFEAGRFSFELEDVHANTLGLPEYPGLRPAVISIELQRIDESTRTALKSMVLPARIYELEMTDEATEMADVPRAMTLRLWPDGCFELPTVRGELLLK